jgi:hypothetical protein
LRVERADIVTGAVLFLGRQRAMAAAQGATTAWVRAYQQAIVDGELRPVWLAEQSANRSVATGAAVETHQAFGSARRSAFRFHEARLRELDLVRRWNATLDKRTCDRCMRADGTWVEIGDPFPWGEPGAVHPRCRCYDELIPRAWARPADVAA